MALNAPGSNENYTPEQSQDSFTSNVGIESMTPSTIEPMITKFENAGFDSVSVDQTEEMNRQRDVSSLAISMRNNFNQPTDKAAKLLKLEMDTGLPAQYIQENMAEVEAQSHMQNFSVEHFREKNPKFAKWVAENPNHFALVKDDLDRFRNIEDQSSVGIGWDSANLQYEKSNLIDKKIAGTFSPADQKREAEIDSLMQAQGERTKDESFSQMLGRTAGYSGSQMVDSAVAGLGGAAIGAQAGLILAPFTGGASIPIGAKIGAVTANTIQAYKMETNFAYDDLSKMSDANGNKIDKETALNVARGIGAINAAIETAGDIMFLKMIPGANLILGSATKSARKTMTEMAIKALEKPAMAQVLGQSAKMMLTGSASEGATEFVQNLVGATGKRVAISADGKINPETSWGDDLSQGALEGKEAFFGSMMTLGLMHGASRFNEHVNTIKNGEENAKFYAAVAGGVQSKAFQSLPEKGQEAVKAAIAGGAHETTYFQADAWDAYWKAKGVDPREVAAQVAEDGGKSYDKAFDGGGHISMPTEKMGAKLLANGEHKELMLDATTDPNKETAREAMKAREELQTEVEAAKNGTQSTQSETSKVEQNIFEQLKKSKDPGDARKKAKLFASINETMAKDAGVTPEAFYEKYGLKISRILPERLVQKNINELDPLIERIRAGNIPTESQARGMTLTEFLRDKGGINDVGQGSDIASFEADKGSAKGFKRLTNKKSGMDVDRAAILAHEAGYISNPDTRELIDSVAKDLRSEPVYSSQNEDYNLSETRQVLNEFKSHLDKLGVDLNSHDNETIKKMLAENRANPTADDNIFLQGAYHGSPYRFDKFTLDAIGSGEGNQAYGWGLYFAGNKEVAEFYRNELGDMAFSYDGKTLEKNTPKSDAVEILWSQQGNIEAAIEDASTFENKTAIIKEIKKLDYSKIKKGGQLYHVDIPEDGSYLLWDKPLSQQSEEVKKALNYDGNIQANFEDIKNELELFANNDGQIYKKLDSVMKLVDSYISDPSNKKIRSEIDKIFKDYGLNDDGNNVGVLRILEDKFSEDSGKSVYQKLAEEKGSQEAASKYLHSLGLNGIKYLDSYSRNSLGDSYNYVVFDDKSIGIVKKFYQGRTVFNKENIPQGVGVPSEISVVKATENSGSILDASKEIKEKFQGKSFENIHTGEMIGVSSDSVKKFSGGGAKKEFIAAGLNLNKIIENAIHVSDDENTDNASKVNIPTFGRYYSAMSFNGKDYLVRLKVANTKNNGKKFYHEVVVESERPSGNLGGNNQNRSNQSTSAFTWPSKISIEQFLNELNTTRSIREWFQRKQALAASPQGRIRISPNRIMNIDLYATANFSTFLHEQGHYWLEVMGDIAESPTGSDRIKGMYAETLKFLGVENRSQIETKHHEMFAEAFEKYLMEGKAPTSKLQEMFNTFKAWMQWVYQSLKGLNVELSPEIRNVFDRMIASDEEIARSKQEQSMNPLILDPVMAGMTEEQAAKYTKLIDEAKAEAEHELTVKMMKQLQKERTSAWKEERKEVKAQMEYEVDSQADQVLIKILKTGKLESAGLENLKLDKKAVIDAYGKEFADKLPRNVFGKDGYDHNTLASMLGFENGWQMIEMIANAQERNALIEQKTNDEMLARHGDEDIYTNGKLHEEALNAVHNDKRAELMRMEMDWLMQNRTKDAKGLIKTVARRVPTVMEAREKAESQINEMVVSSIKPYQFLRAEKKHANDALNFMLKGDFEQAYASKKKELLNHELYRAAVNAKEDIDKMEGRFNKFFQEDSKLAKTRDMNLIGAGRAILSSFGFSNDTRSPEQHLDQMKRYDPQGYEFLKARIDAATENADFYGNLTYEKFSALHDLTQGLWDQSKSEKLIEIDGKKFLIDDALAEISQGLSKLPVFDPKKDKYSRTASDDDNNLNSFQTLKARMTRMEFKVDSMDAFAGGVFRNFIFNPIRNATEKYREKKGDVIIKMNKLIQDHSGNFGGKEIVAENLNFVFKNKGELLGAMLHIGTESNFKKLILGNEWGTKREDGSLDSSRWDLFIDELERNGTLHESDYKFLESIWDLVDSFKADTQRAHKEMNGFYFSEIRGREVKTSFGTFKGGYVPATADKLRSRDPQIRNEKAMIEDNFHSELPQKLDGFSKAREENYSTPLIMDIGLITSHIDNALRYTYITPRVKEVMKLVHNRDMRSQLDAYDPAFVSHVVIPFLQRATTQSTTVMTQNKHADKFFSFAKNNSAIQLMFMNLPNTIQQVANYIPATLKANPIHLLNAIKESTLNSKAIEESISAKSVYMKNRIETLSEKSAIQIENTLKDRGSFERGSVWLAKNAYIAQTYLQTIMDKHVWLASYDQAIADGMDEGQAVNHADTAIRSTQGSFAPEDTAAIETNTPLMKTLMMFYGFFNNMGNLYTSEWNKAGALEGGKREIKRATIIANYFLFAFAGKLAIDSVRGQIGKPEDDKESLEFWFKYFFGSAFELSAPMGGVPGQLAYAGYKNLIGESSYNDRISVSPLISSAEQLAKGVKNITKDGASQKTVTKDVMTLMADSPMIGFIPVKGVSVLQKGAGYSAAIGALKRPVGYAVGVQEGKDSAETPLDVVQGVVSGSSKR